MGLLGTVTEAVSGDRSPSAAEETFAYRCVSCGERFELPKSQMTAARCPDCGSRNVKDAGDR
ncbi:zinc ribbon domain-containing protein [Halobium salinum]|uniref:Zinc ribbon domain-containing protein n=1 Tax=Halobium salinum TaxID=1364940 RepID=A0ABD5P722_9EURY|nr:zinc ribbon domain-containing protein [Halobium salinum]